MGSFISQSRKNGSVIYSFLRKRGHIVYLAALKKGAIRAAHPYYAHTLKQSYKRTFQSHFSDIALMILN